MATTLEEMWGKELAALDRDYDAYKIKRERIQAGGASNVQKKTIVKQKNTAVPKK